MKPNTCRLVTLGCKVNQYETQFVKEALEANGYREAADGEGADLCVVNTCTVTMEGDAKSRQLIRRLHHANPEAAIVVMGCYATRSPDTVTRLPGVRRVVTDKQRLAEGFRDFGVEHWPQGITRFDGHQRAFVKVQDGCLLNCTYCIIPQVRPVVRSRPIAEILHEVRGLIDEGFHEIVLTGIHLGHYGLDLSKGKPKGQWQRLWHLLEKLAALPGQFRIRLSSLEAAEARDDLARVLAGHPRIVPHLHLCLQSGSDRILARMKRRYRSHGFLQRIERLCAVLDQPAFTTDVIVGFPGETEEDFDATLRIARQVGFAKMHLFSYSRREDTPAAIDPEQVPPAIVRQRRERLAQLDRGLAAQYAASLIGRKLEVLVEGVDPRNPDHVMGTSCRYVTVSLPGKPERMVKQLVQVCGQRVEAGVILASPVAPAGPDLPARLAPPAERATRWELPLIAG